MKFDKFEIIWIEICTYQRESGVPTHRHDFFHYIYVDSGQGNITVGDESFTLAVGNIYPIPPDTDHTFHNSGDEPLITLELKFAMEKGETEGELICLPKCMNVTACPAKACLMTLYRETRSRQTRAENVAKLHFHLLLNYLLRCNDSLMSRGERFEQKKNSSADIEKAVAYISEHLAEDITLDCLADILGFEKNYFLRKFKRYTGKTPTVFITDKRLEKAKELLRFSDMNITQIAAASGFKSVHYFSKVFFDNVKIRPSEWRSQKL